MKINKESFATTSEFHASSTDITAVNLADDVEQVGSGDHDIDHYSPKTQGKCLALATGLFPRFSFFV